MDHMGRTAAVILAAGRGTRMGTTVHKQYLELNGKPLLYYSLLAFENSSIDDIILVSGEGQEQYCRREIVDFFGFRKVRAITAGGRERYHSVYAGLSKTQGADYVLIHDGARPCVTKEIIENAIEGAENYGACVVGMPVKDTIKVSDLQGFASETPDRSTLWLIQTPQAFEQKLIVEAYEKLMESESSQMGITDDGMVVETMTDKRVKLIQGSYSNIKVTTPEDLEIAEILLKRHS